MCGCELKFGKNVWRDYQLYGPWILLGFKTREVYWEDKEDNEIALMDVWGTFHNKDLASILETIEL